jgi:hypothetical protein
MFTLNGQPIIQPCEIATIAPHPIDLEERATASLCFARVEAAASLGIARANGDASSHT